MTCIIWQEKGSPFHMSFTYSHVALEQSWKINGIVTAVVVALSLSLRQLSSFFFGVFNIYDSMYYAYSGEHHQEFLLLLMEVWAETVQICRSLVTVSVPISGSECYHRCYGSVSIDTSWLLSSPICRCR